MEELKNAGVPEDTFEGRLKKAHLTRSGREIAQYLLDNLLKVSCMTATSIAQELNISDVTVIRFARSLGYEGYNDMQKALQQRMFDYMENSQPLLAYPSLVLQVNMDASSNSSMVELAVNNEVKNLGKFAERNQEEIFIRAADLVLASRRKVVFGVRGSAAMAFSFSMRLRYLVDDVFHTIYADPNDSYALYTLTDQDCLVVFGFVNYPQATIDAVDLAKERGAKIVVFTDLETSPLANRADVVIICSVSGISFSSYTMPMLASEIVAANIAKRIGPAAEVRNQAMVDNLRDRKYFSPPIGRNHIIEDAQDKP